jgi:hypothetical protein
MPERNASAHRASLDATRGAARGEGPWSLWRSPATYSPRPPVASPVTHRLSPLNRRLRMQFLAGAEEGSHRRLWRGLTTDELEGVLRRYPGEVGKRVERASASRSAYNAIGFSAQPTCRHSCRVPKNEIAATSGTTNAHLTASPPTGTLPPSQPDGTGEGEGWCHKTLASVSGRHDARPTLRDHPQG